MFTPRALYVYFSGNPNPSTVASESRAVEALKTSLGVDKFGTVIVARPSRHDRFFGVASLNADVAVETCLRRGKSVVSMHNFALSWGDNKPYLNCFRDADYVAAEIDFVCGSAVSAGCKRGMDFEPYGGSNPLKDVAKNVDGTERSIPLDLFLEIRDQVSVGSRLAGNVLHVVTPKGGDLQYSYKWAFMYLGGLRTLHWNQGTYYKRATASPWLVPQHWPLEWHDTMFDLWGTFAEPEPRSLPRLSVAEAQALEIDTMRKWFPETVGQVVYCPTIRIPGLLSAYAVLAQTSPTQVVLS